VVVRCGTVLLEDELYGVLSAIRILERSLEIPGSMQRKYAFTGMTKTTKSLPNHQNVSKFIVALIFYELV